MTEATNPCCSAHDDLSAELDGMAADPALQDCCRRDLKEQAYVARVKRELLAHDRTDTRKLIADQVVRHDFESRCSGDADSLASGSDEDALELVCLRKLRLNELKEHALLKSRLQSSGGGSLNTVLDSSLLREIHRIEAQTVVCHIVIAGTQLGEQMDEHLAGLAHTYLGTRFLRAPLSRQSPLPKLLGLEHASDGAATARTPAYAFSDGVDLHEEDVTAWLCRAGALHGAAGGRVDNAVRKQGDSVEASEDEEDEEGDWKEPCSECGRRYYHEHIRTVHASNACGDTGEER